MCKALRHGSGMRVGYLKFSHSVHKKQLYYSFCLLKLITDSMLVREGFALERSSQSSAVSSLQVILCYLQGDWGQNCNISNAQPCSAADPQTLLLFPKGSGPGKKHKSFPLPTIHFEWHAGTSRRGFSNLQC